MSAATAKTADDLRREAAEAVAAAERLEQASAAARQTPPSRAEAMLGQAPAFVKSLSQSKPFSLHRFLCGIIGKSSPEFAAHEFDVLNRYHKALQKSGCHLNNGSHGGLWLPMNINETYGGQLTQDTQSEENYNYVKAVMEVTRPEADPEELRWLERKRYIKAAQSAYTDSLGGSLVAPPVQGDILPLIRPNAAFLAAGAQAMTLPPNGRFVAPRILSAPDVKAIGEGQETALSDMTTGQMELTAKKFAGAVSINEEATAFTSGTMDAIAQAELGRSLGLRADAYAFYGIGSTQIPAGLTSNVYADQVINVETSYGDARGIGADGNDLLPQYGDILPALIAERSFNIDATTGSWVMRPGPFATSLAVRADAVTTGDQAGQLVDWQRRYADTSPTRWRGRQVVQTTNLKNNYTKGSGSNLSDVFYGIWSYGIMATYGAINFQQGHNGSTFLNGQYIIRGTMYGDIGFQYPSAFLWYPNTKGLSNNF